MACLGRSPQRSFGQVRREHSSRTALLGHALGVGLFCAVPTALQAQAAERAEQSAPAPALADLVSVDAGATCLDRDTLIERIERWRQHASVDLSIRVQVRGDPELATRVFFSVVRVGTPPTERVLNNAPAECDQLHSAVALSIALAIDAILSADRATLLAPVAIAPKVTPPPVAKPGLRRSGGPSRYVEVGLMGGASVGVVTNLAAAGLPRLQFAPLPWFAVAVTGLATRDGRATIAGADGQFSASVLAAGLDACAGGETLERLSFFMCAGARGGQFVTDGSGYSPAYHRSFPWWALASSGQARAWIVPSVGIGIGVEALFALVPRDLVAYGSNGSPSLTRSVPRVGLSIAVGPVFRFF